jgi:hypothetical protein
MENHGASPSLGKHIHAGPEVMEVSRIVIDQPQNRRLTKSYGAITGWFALRGQQEVPEEMEFRVGPIILPHVVLKRPDVEGAMPEHTVLGFQVRFDLANYLYHIKDNHLDIQLTMADYDSMRLRFTIQESAMAACIAAASGV